MLQQAALFELINRMDLRLVVCADLPGGFEVWVSGLSLT